MEEPRRYAHAWPVRCPFCAVGRVVLLAPAAGELPDRVCHSRPTCVGYDAATAAEVYALLRRERS